MSFNRKQGTSTEDFISRLLSHIPGTCIKFSAAPVQPGLASAASVRTVPKQLPHCFPPALWLSSTDQRWDKAAWAKLLHPRAGAAARSRQHGQGPCEQGGRTGGSLPTPGHKQHVLCTPWHRHIPAHDGGIPNSSKARLPSFCKKSFQQEPFPHLAVLLWLAGISNSWSQ